MGYFWHILATIFVWINKPFVLLVLTVHPVAFSCFENLSRSQGMSLKFDEIKLVSSEIWDNLRFSFLPGILKPWISLCFRMS